MQIEISPEAEAVIHQLVEEGAFDDASSVIEHAVLWLRQSEAEHVRSLRESILHGIGSLEAGRGHRITPELVEDIKRRGRERRATRLNETR